MTILRQWPSEPVQRFRPDVQFKPDPHTLERLKAVSEALAASGKRIDQRGKK